MITGVIKNKVDKIWLDIFSAGLANPLHTALEAASLRIGAARHSQAGVRCDQRQRQEEGLIRMLLCMIYNPFLGTGRKQIGTVAGIQLIGDYFGAIPDGIAAHIGIHAMLFFRVVTVTGNVVVIAEEIILASLGGPSHRGFGCAATFLAAAYSPLTDESGSVAFLFQHLQILD